MNAEQLEQQATFSPVEIQGAHQEIIKALDQGVELKKAKIDLINYIDWNDPKYAELVQMRIDNGRTFKSFIHRITSSDGHYNRYLSEGDGFESLKLAFINKSDIYGVDLLLYGEEGIAVVKTILSGHIMGRASA